MSPAMGRAVEEPSVEAIGLGSLFIGLMLSIEVCWVDSFIGVRVCDFIY